MIAEAVALTKRKIPLENIREINTRHYDELVKVSRTISEYNILMTAKELGIVINASDISIDKLLQYSVIHQEVMREENNGKR